MTLSLLIPVAVWLLIMLVGPILAFVLAPKPFTLLQRAGLLVSLVALLIVLTTPFVSIGGVLNFNIYQIFHWIGEANDSLLCVIADVYLLTFLSLLFVAPMVSAALYIGRKWRIVAGLLLLLSPLYVVLLPLLDDSFKGVELAVGGVLYLLCGVVLLALPWFIKEKEDVQPSIVASVSIVLLAVGMSPSVFFHYHWRSDSIDDKSGDSTEELVEDAEVVETVEVESNESAMTFIKGDAKMSESFKSSELDYSGAMYHYRSGGMAYNVQLVSDHGDMVIRAYDANHNDAAARYLEAGELFYALPDDDGQPMGCCGEYGFAQYDFDGDGIDELLVATRSTWEPGDNYVNVNIYRMQDFHCWSLPAPVNNDGATLRFCWPCIKVEEGTITIYDKCNEGYNIFIWKYSDGDFSLKEKRNVRQFVS